MYRDHVVRVPVGAGEVDRYVPWLSQLAKARARPAASKTAGKTAGKAAGKVAGKVAPVKYVWVRLPKDAEQCYCLLHDTAAAKGDEARTMLELVGLNFNLSRLMRMLGSVSKRLAATVPGTVNVYGISSLEQEDPYSTHMPRTDSGWLETSAGSGQSDPGTALWTANDVQLLRDFVIFRQCTVRAAHSMGPGKNRELAAAIEQATREDPNLRHVQIEEIPTGGVRLMFT